MTQLPIELELIDLNEIDHNINEEIVKSQKIF